MNSAVINIKTDPKVKAQAQKIASNLGFSLSAFLNASLKQLVRSKAVNFSLSEEPSDYLIKQIKNSEKELKRGETSPSFDNAEDAISWLNMSDKKYAG